MFFSISLCLSNTFKNIVILSRGPFDKVSVSKYFLRESSKDKLFFFAKSFNFLKKTEPKPLFGMLIILSKDKLSSLFINNLKKARASLISALS